MERQIGAEVVHPSLPPLLVRWRDGLVDRRRYTIEGLMPMVTEIW